MDAARGEVSQRSFRGNNRAPAKWPCTLLGVLLAAALVLPAASALAQDSGGGGGGIPMPKFSIGGEQKRKLTPEEEEQQKQIDADYKAATKKIPDQKAADPWADVRQAPAGLGQKASPSTQSASAKKKQPAQ
jgi:Spy/CpxP family protein refolding chaperone